jgi:hypothetical protein
MICSVCGVPKLESRFPFRNKRKNILHRRCKDCRRVHDKEYRKQRESNRDYVRSEVGKYLKENPCVDCGEKDIVVLDFDHVRGEKVCAVSNMINQFYGWKTVLSEIEKCDVRCSNCHRRKHAMEKGWYRTKEGSCSKTEL